MLIMSYKQGTGRIGFDLSVASYDGVSFDASNEETFLQAIAFNTLGTKMYLLGSNSNAVHQYSLSTDFDLTTASYDSVSFNISQGSGSPRDVVFSPNGTKMFVVEGFSNTIYQYTLSTGFDLSSASYDSVSFGVSGEDTNPNGVTFNTSGTKMLVVGASTDTVYQYTLSTGFDLSSASYDSVSFGVGGQENTPQDIVTNSDGTKMFIIGSGSDTVYQYTMTTGFDLSSASYDSVSFGVGGQDNAPRDVVFNPNGTKMFIAGTISNTVYQYSL